MVLREFSAGAVVYRSERGVPKYLVLHYAAGHWDFPKGKIEEGETEKQAALREIFEETGIRVNGFGPGFSRAVRYFFTRGGKKVFKRAIFFVAETSSKRVRLSDEHVGFAWLGLKAAEKRLTYGNARKVLEAADGLVTGKVSGRARRPAGRKCP